MNVKVQDCECGNLVQVGMKACPFCGRPRESEGVVVDITYCGAEGMREAYLLTQSNGRELDCSNFADGRYRLTRIEEGGE